MLQQMHQLAKVPWQAVGLNQGAFVILCALDEQACSGNPEMTVSELAEVYGITKAGVSQILRGLEDRGLVERHPRAGDRRVVCVRLTPDGLAVVERAKAAYENIMGQVFEQLGEKEAQELDYLLGRFCSILDGLTRERPRRSGKPKEATCVDS